MATDDSAGKEVENMSLKDFSFAQLDKSARLSVGKTEEKSDKKESVVYLRCNVTGSCRHFNPA